MTVTLATVITEFLSRPDLAKSTRRTYELVLKPILGEYGIWEIEIIGKQTLIEYLRSLDDCSYTTHRKYQAILQSLFNFAVEQGYIKFNPINGLKQRQPNPDRGEHKTDSVVRYLTPEQLNILYYSVKSDLRMNAIVHLLHRSGCRISELLALNIDDVNQDLYKFQVLGKGNKRRCCYFSDGAAEALSKFILYERHNTVDALFTAQQPVTKVVSRISYRTVHEYWRELISIYPELVGVRIHDLRHTFATERVGLMGIEELRALMGHENIQTTLRYQKVTSARAEEVARQALKSLT
ncbi:tyrosine-type recombinase/integrase [Nostoc sp. KVJ3]|uniref:tyrosine-type recombinase/integrase n=2 Tax=Nostoc sp. KVJ3 TaxID=457945 RepID=UPI002237CB80|nr:tyrosine-type recombinase/integrase [Nostoc sp. KVJ3]MCW5318149.1 tyrosine-type recombinase/integrase [Nostoc sp. KVJ3]MCW5318591.1 tyrosine-type recombinase/integrase [Nostoc sp. KVJ3]MCW5319497.1 tyrosine-type recombinase/integrase [Nostoc sp. KVJ3]